MLTLCVVESKLKCPMRDRIDAFLPDIAKLINTIDPPIKADIVVEIKPSGSLNFIYDEDEIDADTSNAMCAFEYQVALWLRATRH